MRRAHHFAFSRRERSLSFLAVFLFKVKTTLTNSSERVSEGLTKGTSECFCFLARQFCLVRGFGLGVFYSLSLRDKD